MGNNVSHLEDQICPKCGFPTNERLPVYVESWEDVGMTLTGKQEFKVRYTDIPAYCSDCTSGLFKRRLLAAVVAALPLWFFAGAAGAANGGGSLILMGLYALFLLRRMKYSWADQSLYGWELEMHLASKTESLRPDIAGLKFPVGFLHSLLRLGFYFGSTFAVAMFSAALFQGILAAPPSSSSDREAYEAEGKNQTEVAEDLLRAFEWKELADVKQIVEASPDILTFADENGASVLHLAARIGKPDMVRFFLKNGGKLQATDKAQQTPLHYAAKSSHWDNVKVLCEQGARMEAPDQDGKTPLYVAVESRCYQAAEYLLKRGARPNVKPKNGKSALALAREQRFGEMIPLLEQYQGTE